MDFILKVNGKILPTPSSMSFTLQDYDSENSKRTISGKMTRDRIRANTLKISVSFAPLFGDELKKIINAVTPQFFNVEVLDPRTNSIQTLEMYCGDKAFDTLRIFLENGKVKYSGLSFSLIER